MDVSAFTALELAKNIKNRQISVREATEQVLSEMEAKEDLLHCYVYRNGEQALKRADEVQKQLDKGLLTSPLAGVPLGVKDNLCTMGIPTTCCSRLLEHFVPSYSAAVVKKLEDAGVILMGKTNMDEFAFGQTTETSCFGPTANPADPVRSPGGSSGGSAAAVAAGEAFMALGTDTGGSVRQPASHCGVVGVKPTYGSLSRWGLIAYASSMDQVGTLTRDVADAAAMLEVMFGKDPKDSTSLQHPRPDLTAFLSPDRGLKGIRIGVPADLLGRGLTEPVRKALCRAADALEEMGAGVEWFDIGLGSYYVPTYYLIAMAEASSNLARFDGVKYGFRTEMPRDLQDLYAHSRSEAFGSEVKRRILMGTRVLSKGYYEAYYKKALQVRHLIRDSYDRALAKYDCILSPVAASAAPLLGTAEDPLVQYENDLFTVAANLTGLPALSLPWMRDPEGLPMGIQLMAGAFEEGKLLRIASALERSRDTGTIAQQKEAEPPTMREKAWPDEKLPRANTRGEAKSEAVQRETPEIICPVKRDPAEKAETGETPETRETRETPETPQRLAGAKPPETEYETVIGLEVHVELSTATKIFCGCSTAFGAAPNTQVCPMCMGMPGTLPVLNRKVLEAAIGVGLATGCSITPYGRFDRKNYFYPDNPQNYQISQLYLPICTDGAVDVKTPEGDKTVRIHEIHMEEDAGKLTHHTDGRHSLVDFNRAGVPLLEIVSEPDLRSGPEAVAYLEKLRSLISYLGVSDCKMQEGSLRADVNLSVRKKGDKTLGTRTEMKNLGSFRAVLKAVEAERDRQISLLEAGERVIQETRRFDEETGRSYSMRNKENAADYRYFPDPDLPPIRITPEQVDKVRSSLPEFREPKIQRFMEQYGLPEYDCNILTETRELADFYEKCVGTCHLPKKASNWIMGEVLRLLKEQEREMRDLPLSPEHLGKLICMVEEKRITAAVGKQILEKMFSEDFDPETHAKEKGLFSLQDEDHLKRTVDDVLHTCEGPVKEYLSGKEKVLGFLVGQTMKALGGQASPETVRQLLLEALEQLRAGHL